MSVLAVLKSLAILIVVILLWNARSQTKGVTHARKMSTDPEIAKLSGTITDVRTKNGRSLVKIEDRHGRYFWAIVRDEMLQVGDRMSFEMTVAHHHYYVADFGLSLPECYIVSVFDIQPGERASV
ncbi:MAG TPA: hypothetical protein VFO10_07425 [Oligoflexus sp.]|uniref:hypothetical protein n=1 Tax=Oligoflexus sp. TaxID=1971216 RepID=UPI002D80B75E|nr:hypothetical protein [Oligoflexus sp.]HET9237063.1 hypothetical protein [Oligoflexus sp.]